MYGMKWLEIVIPARLNDGGVKWVLLKYQEQKI